MATRMQQAGESARSIAEETGTAASSVADSAAAQGKQLALEARDDARELFDEARSTAKSEVDNQAQRIGENLHRMSEQFDSMASAADQPNELPAQIVRRMGSGLDTVANKLDHEGVDGIVDDVKRYARANPMVFLFGAAAAGFVVGRVMRNMNRRGVLEVAKAHATGDGDGDRTLATNRLADPALSTGSMGQVPYDPSQRPQPADIGRSPAPSSVGATGHVEARGPLEGRDV